MRTQNSMSFLLLAAFVLLSPASVRAAIENDPKKEYKLDSRHGPWMVMVGTFSNVEDASLKKDGLTAEQAARKVVHELRAAGIPAYVYSQDKKQETIETYDRLGNKDKRKYNAQFGMVCVLAGNYKKIDDKQAQDTLRDIKKFRPKFMTDPKSGAVVRESSSNKLGPFANAFLTINPQLKPKDVVEHTVDNVVRSLNSGIDYPVVGLKSKYTLKIATFTGKSVVPVGNSKYSGKEENFDKAIQESAGPYSLARAGEDATQLTYALRANNGVTRPLGRDQFDAYVYHDRFQSYVTIGAFNSPNDPEIKRLVEIFMASYELRDGEYQFNCKTLSLPNRDPNSPPIQTWAFDPMPKLIEVPRIK